MGGFQTKMSLCKNAVVLKLAAVLLVAAAMPATVRGQNHHDHDVDVEVVNTPNVKVVNTPSVNVNNLPAVQLAPGTAVTVSGTPTVQVGNTAANPVPVHDTATPNRTPFQVAVDVSIPDGSVDGFGTINVPNGKRLVIEYASAVVDSQAGPVSYLIFTQDASGSSNRQFLTTSVLDFGAVKRCVAGQVVKMFFDAPQVFVNTERPGTTGRAPGLFAISGYLEDVQ
jgi:hypothetical protein